MNRMIRWAACTAVVALSCGGGRLWADAPVVSDVEMMQDSATRTVTITYSLDADAVVTLDIQTNASAGVWASIGGANIQCVSGAVFRKVTAADADALGRYTITWHPDLSWPDHKITDNGARAVVTAWALDNTPDYMVVDIAAAAQPGDVRYYPGVEWLPGGILNNTDYRQNKIVMRKIMAKGVTYTMGSVGEDGRESAKEATHTVMLTNNYYIGVFEVTQTQWAQLMGTYPAYFTDVSMRAMRPVEFVSYNEIRRGADKNTVSNGEWPDAPASTSFLGVLYNKTGIDFDLPSEAQWEFACRAGNGEGFWGDGSAIVSKTADVNCPGRTRGNLIDPNVTSPGKNGTTNQATNVCGSYAPNSWGLYDMHGNVWEWCLDFYAPDVSSLNGAVNTIVGDLAKRVRRGGGWVNYPYLGRSAVRYDSPANTTDSAIGFRLACRAGLK